MPKKIHHRLMEAYLGSYEDKLRSQYNMWADRQALPSKDYDAWASAEVEAKIRAHTPKERLDTYLEWNGILGWTEAIWSISQGEFES